MSCRTCSAVRIPSYEARVYSPSLSDRRRADVKVVIEHGVDMSSSRYTLCGRCSLPARALAVLCLSETLRQALHQRVHAPAGRKPAMVYRSTATHRHPRETVKLSSPRQAVAVGERRHIHEPIYKLLHETDNAEALWRRCHLR